MWWGYYTSYYLLIPAILFTFYAQAKVSSNFKRYSKVRNDRNPVSYTHLDVYKRQEYSTAKMRDYVKEFEANAITEMKGEGFEYLTATDEMQAQFREIGKEIAHEDYWMDLLGEDLVDQMYPEA